MRKVVISGTGLFTPDQSISNEELVAALNAFVAKHNAEHAAEIEAGTVEKLEPSSPEFIVKASGVKSRYVMDKAGVLDPERMRPRLDMRSEDQLSIQAEMAVEAAHGAMKAAGKLGSDIDCVLVACSNLQRAYPAVSVEVQEALGAGGYGYDMNVACSSATFGLQAAVDAVRMGSANVALVISPEITSGHNNFMHRDSHFIFGDACTALIVEAADTCTAEVCWEILGTKLATKFSNNIRNDYGFLTPTEDGARHPFELVFRQNGRAVFKEVSPMVARHIEGHLAEHNLAPSHLRRMWLHQANANMNQLIAKKILGREATEDEAPVILDTYANTSSAGSVIAFHKHSDDMAAGDLGILCSFGAGYSIGSVIVRKEEAAPIAAE